MFSICERPLCQHLLLCQAAVSTSLLEACKDPANRKPVCLKL